MRVHLHVSCTYMWCAPKARIHFFHTLEARTSPGKHAPNSKLLKFRYQLSGSTGVGDNAKSRSSSKRGVVTRIGQSIFFVLLHGLSVYT